MNAIKRNAQDVQQNADPLKRRLLKTSIIKTPNIILETRIKNADYLEKEKKNQHHIKNAQYYSMSAPHISGKTNAIYSCPKTPQ
jgi:hypothetical protein